MSRAVRIIGNRKVRNEGILLRNRRNAVWGSPVRVVRSRYTCGNRLFFRDGGFLRVKILRLRGRGSWNILRLLPQDRDGIRDKGGGRGNGSSVYAVALHISHQSLPHFHGRFPTVCRIRRDGLHDDLCQLVIRVYRRDGTSLRIRCGFGKDTIVVDFVQDHTDPVGIHGIIEGVQIIPNLGRGVCTAILLGKRSIGQRLQIHKSKVTNPEFPLFGDEDISGLQVYIQIPAAAADGHCGAQIQRQIDGIQVGHHTVAQKAFQTVAVGAYKINFKTGLSILHRNHLPAFERQEALQLGKGLQKLGFGLHACGHIPEVFHSIRSGFIGAGENQRIQLHLRGRYRDNFTHIFFFGFFLQDRAAADTVAFAHHFTRHKAVQQRRDQFQIRHTIRLLQPVYHKIKFLKKQLLFQLFSCQKNVIICRNNEVTSGQNQEESV